MYNIQIFLTYKNYTDTSEISVIKQGLILLHVIQACRCLKHCLFNRKISKIYLIDGYDNTIALINGVARPKPLRQC